MKPLRLLLALAILTLVAFTAHAATPSFDSFSTNDFLTTKTVSPWVITAKRSGVTNVYNNSYVTYSNSVVTVTNSTLVITNSTVIFNGDTNAIERLWTNSAFAYRPTELQVEMDVTNLISANNLTASGGFLTDPSYELLVLGVNCVTVAYRTYITVASTDPDPTLTTLSLPTGEPGKWLVLQNRQASGNSFTLFDDAVVCDVGGGHVRLASDWTPSQDGETLELICDGTDWIERGRYNPNVPGGPQLWQLVVAGGVTNLEPVSLDGWKPLVQNGWYVGTNTPAWWGGAAGGVLVSQKDGDLGEVTEQRIVLHSQGQGSSGQWSVDKDTNYVTVNMRAKATDGTDLAMDFNIGDLGQNSIISSYGGVDGIRLFPDVADGSIPYSLNSHVTHTSGDFFRLLNNSTVIDATAAVSGWTGGGTKVKYDDGTYKAPAINPTDLFFPYRTSATTFGDSPLYVESTNSVVMTNSAASMTFRLQNTSGSATLGVTTGGHAIVLGGVGETVFIGANGDGSGTVACDATGFAPTTSGVVSSGSVTGRWKSLYLAGMTKAQKALLTPTDGMIVYQTDNTPGFRGYVNGAWVIFSTAADP